MPSKTDEIIAAFEELLKRRGTQKPTDRLGLERPVMSRDFENKPMAGWEKAASLIGAAVSPVSTIASILLAPPAEETIFERQIKGPDGKYTIVPEGSQAAVPRMKKVQRAALKTLNKFPTKEDYLHGAGSEGYSQSAKKFGIEAPQFVTIGPKDFTGTARVPASDLIAEYIGGKPVGAVTFDPRGKVNIAGVLPEHQGKGIGKELYKKAAMLGKDIYELGITSQDAARARYNAIQDLAKGSFPKKPQRIDKLGALEKKLPETRNDAKPVDDWNRMLYFQEIMRLHEGFKSGEITAAGYRRGRDILDSGPFRDVARSARDRASQLGIDAYIRMLDFSPK